MTSWHKDIEPHVRNVTNTSEKPPPESLPQNPISLAPIQDPQQNTQQPDAVIKNLLRAWESVKSMQADIKIYSKTDPAKNGKGTLQYIQDGHLGKYRYDLLMEGVDDTPNHQMTGTAIFDGAMIKLKTSFDNMPFSQETQPSLMPGPPPGGPLFFELLQRDYKLYQDKQRNSDSLIYLIGEPSSSESKPDVYDQVAVTLDPSSGGLRKLEVHMKSGGEVLAIEVLSPVFNIPIDETQFISDLASVTEGIN
ncbi:MAG TPA: hypothetical protein PLI09_26790 [Candidatus Hydrogenedentes bacterium]|nr:hypothetical protein [Candidatus Hydrogenedentota bacterium]